MALRKKRSKARNKKAALPEVNININALLDVLTVLLFFLIKSFSVTSISVASPEELRLPASVSDDERKESPTVMLSQNKLSFKSKTITKLKNGRFPKNALGSDERTIPQLKKILSQEFDKKMAVFEDAGDTSFIPPGKITIQSDKRLRFGTVKKLLHTAAAAGYTDYQFVIEGEQN